MLQPVFPLFSSGITAPVFASARGGQVADTLEAGNFGVITLGKCVWPADTFWVLDYWTQFTL